MTSEDSRSLFGSYPKYVDAVEEAFGANVDFAQLVKSFGHQSEDDTIPSVSTMARRVTGCPDPKYVSTSLIERQNLTMRMGMKRFTRKTNGFSKKIENHAHNVAFHFMYYNFVRIHQTLRVTPAMAAGVTDKLWSFEDIIALAYPPPILEAPFLRPASHPSSRL